jgi:predicted DNA-binding WGR domain protein
MMPSGDPINTYNRTITGRALYWLHYRAAAKDCRAVFKRFSRLLKVLEHDKKPKWWVFRSWGRVGTTIGGTKLDSFDERLDATRLDRFDKFITNANKMLKNSFISSAKRDIFVSK